MLCQMQFQNCRLPLLHKIYSNFQCYQPDRKDLCRANAENSHLELLKKKGLINNPTKPGVLNVCLFFIQHTGNFETPIPPPPF